ncbi:unnamed protein product [Strongylus vulgaris]|uniref:Uncharacterized protein n=1 Tax=Strongylus vulgaris TaxID=40348 RepID=A0A3P7L0Q5_STRVU|nr:unnamed protein product [Strongylus vulgaris]
MGKFILLLAVLSLVTLGEALDCKEELGEDSLADNYREILTNGIKKICDWLTYECRLEEFALMTLRNETVKARVRTSTFMRKKEKVKSVEGFLKAATKKWSLEDVNTKNFFSFPFKDFLSANV